MSAGDYNRRRVAEGQITTDDLESLWDWFTAQPGALEDAVATFQAATGLVEDSYLGPHTLERLRHGPDARAWPLVLLPDGRAPVITSRFYTENPERPTHKGVDLFYRWLEDDPDVPVGDGGAITRNGKRRWWYPPRAAFHQARDAVAAHAGIVQDASKIGTGLHAWIDHGNGQRSGYMHLAELYVAKGQEVELGQSIGLCGDSPRGHDALHLHFEISPVDRYAPTNPRLWLASAALLEGRAELAA